MIVARTLQLLGASIEIEPESLSGPRIDFAARFDGSEVNVEATVPRMGRAAGHIAHDHAPLLDIVENLVPEGWGVGVCDLPQLGPNDSRKQFREAVKRAMDTINASERNQVELAEVLDQGELRLRFFPDPPGGAKLVHEAPLAYWDDSEERIRSAVLGKKRQAKAFQGPSLVAVNANGLTSNWEHFDLALYGHSVMVLDVNRAQTATRFVADGLFAERRPEPPVIDGVLAFLRVGFRDFDEPILYRHPRSQHLLPQALLHLEQRTLSLDYDRIISTPSQRRGFLSALGFIPDTI